MAQLGLSLSDVGSTMQLAYAGNDDAKYRDEEDEHDIRVMFDAFDRTNLDDVRNLSFINRRGETIWLSQFADVTRSIGTSKLERRDRTSSVTVQSMVQGRPVGAEIQEALAKANISKKVSITDEGELKQ